MTRCLLKVKIFTFLKYTSLVSWSSTSLLLPSLGLNLTSTTTSLCAHHASCTNVLLILAATTMLVEQVHYVTPQYQLQISPMYWW